MSVQEKFVDLTPAQRENFQWLKADHLRQVVEALEAAETGSVRFVGGCVRDSLLGVTPKDFDIATPLEPKAVVAALKSAGLKSAPTGIEHGTITAIVDHQGVEVTTLRADVSTDGRRATVAFTKDWCVDASRRDFTINAIYLTPDGRLYDPLGGIPDIETKSVRFIGDAEQRIREDYLRILRFFRFSARFSQKIDATGLAACGALKDGIEQLSAERIGSEFMAILSLPRAAFGLTAMQECGVLEKIWPQRADLSAVTRLKEHSPRASAPIVLAALFGEGGQGSRSGLRLSKAEGAIRTNGVNAARIIRDVISDQDIHAHIYRLGRDVFLDGALVAVARGDISTEQYNHFKSVAEDWRVPHWPFTGKDVIALGIAAGPDVARILAAAEARWIEEGFPKESRARAILTEFANTG